MLHASIHRRAVKSGAAVRLKRETCDFIRPLCPFYARTEYQRTERKKSREKGKEKRPDQRDKGDYRSWDEYCSLFQLFNPPLLAPGVYRFSNNPPLLLFEDKTRRVNTEYPFSIVLALAKFPYLGRERRRTASRRPIKLWGII